MFDAVVAVGASVTFVLGSVAMLNVAMTTKTKHMQAWSVMYVFAILAADLAIPGASRFPVLRGYKL